MRALIVTALLMAFPLAAIAAKWTPVADTATAAVSPADTSGDTQSPDSADAAFSADTGKTDDNAISSKTDTVGKTPAAIDTFNVHDATFVGAGFGLSLGGFQLFSLWQDGLPNSLADFGLSGLSCAVPGDSQALTFAARESPDVYNMTFPVAIALGRFSSVNRYQAMLSFSWLNKTARSTVEVGTDADSTGRRIIIANSFGMYTITLDLLYGRAIPEHYFSIDNGDRTDAMVGISASPFILLRKSNTVSYPASDRRLSAVNDSIEANLRSTFSASGIAVGWRMGIVRFRRLSKRGGFDAAITYAGRWSTLFRTNSGSILTEQEVNSRSGDPGKKVSFFSNSVEISFSLVQRLGQIQRKEPQ
jgi:hypothetical protein